VYVVESNDVLLCTMNVGEMTEWLNTLPLGAFKLYTVWYVDEATGEAVRVVCESL
jgi:amino acid permease